MNRMSVAFLGTSGGMPTKKRGLTSIAIRFSGSLLILDCGENTQRQLLQAELGFPLDTRIFITHLHADHILGLPGVIYTLGMLGREAPLFIYGPRGTKEAVEALLAAGRGAVTFDVIVKEVGEGTVHSDRDFVVEAARASHTVEALAYRLRERERPGKMNVEYLERVGLPRGPLWGRLQRGEEVVYKGRVIRPEEAVGPPRPGRCVVYSGDTRPSRVIAEFASGADVLIHDSTFDESLRKKAEEDGHSTAREAAETARDAGAALLVLIHISPRYDGREEVLLQEAKSVFPNVIIPSDLESIDVPYRD